MESASKDVSSDESPSPPLPEGGGSVLLLAPALDRRTEAACTELSCPHEPSEVKLLCVSLDGSVDDVLDRWNRHLGSPPGRLAVVTTGDGIRSTEAVSGGDAPIPGEGGTPVAEAVSTTFVSDAGDLTGLGIKVSQCLSAWDGEDDLAVCVRSLTTLLQFSELKRVFRFVHVLTQRLKSAGAVAHFHMDPAAHDGQTLATLESLFDAVYELDADGSWRRN